MKQKLAESAKLIVALLTILVTAGASVVPVGWVAYLQLAIALIGAAILWLVPNATPASSPAHLAE